MNKQKKIVYSYEDSIVTPHVNEELEREINKALNIHYFGEEFVPLDVEVSEKHRSSHYNFRRGSRCKVRITVDEDGVRRVAELLDDGLGSI